MRHNPANLDPAVQGFMAERHLATLSLAGSGRDPALHVTPVGFSWDDDEGVARVITFAQAHKVRLIEAAGGLVAALSQVDGARWLTLYGTATVTADPVVAADAVRRYAARYRPPADRGADRRVIEVAVDSVVGRA